MILATSLLASSFAVYGGRKTDLGKRSLSRPRSGGLTNHLAWPRGDVASGSKSAGRRAFLRGHPATSLSRGTVRRAFSHLHGEGVGASDPDRRLPLQPQGAAPQRRLADVGRLRRDADGRHPSGASRCQESGRDKAATPSTICFEAGPRLVGSKCLRRAGPHACAPGRNGSRHRPSRLQQVAIHHEASANNHRFINVEPKAILATPPRLASYGGLNGQCVAGLRTLPAR